MDSKGNDALLTTTKKSEFNFNYGGYVPVSFSVLLLLGCISAYAIAVLRGNVDPILPLISDAAGSPPQNGLFGTLICLGAMIGVIFMVQRYMIVKDKNREKNGFVIAINHLSLFVGCVSMFGIIILTGYPVNFYRNRDIWLKDVGVPHMIGGVMFSAMGLVYISLQCVLTLFVKTAKSRCTILPLRFLLLFICTAAFVYHMITVPDHIGGISHLYFINGTAYPENDTSLLPYPPTLGSDLKLPIDTSGTYFMAAVTQWLFVVFFCCFFFTFFSELQEYSLLFVIETHISKQPVEVPEESKIDFRKASLALSNGSVIDAKPAPEVRKFLRRDSTCQTLDDDQNKILHSTNKNKKVNASNGIDNLALDPELDAKLSRILKEANKPESKVSENGTQHNQSTDCEKQRDEKADSEEERIAIEKIDTVVKNAEKDVSLDVDSPPKIEVSAAKSVEDEEKPSSCPLAVQ